ncbi:armadillo-type protein [Pavlovales sp. CCMP2436]|nr:armadillo-type protein [Pavlovales sp. CCMP2436]
MGTEREDVGIGAGSELAEFAKLLHAACAPVGIVAAPVVVTVRAVRVRRGVLGPVCRAAVCVCSERARARMRLRLATGVPALVARQRGADGDDQACAALVLWQQALDDEGTCALIAAAGALPLFVDLLRSSHAETKRNAALALALLARDESVCQRIVNSSALPPFIALLSSTDIQACKNACNALKYRAADVQVRELALKQGAVGVLAAAALASGCAREHAERDALAKGFDSLVSIASPVAAGHDVEFHCADGEQIGGCQLLLVRASPYYRALLSGTEEGTSGIVKPDSDFSSAAHRALLGQLHALGHAPLPAPLDVRLELLCLVAKVRAPPSDEEGSADDAAARVLERCARAVRDSLCGDKCLAVLMRLKPYAGSVAEAAVLVEVAHALLAKHVATVLKQPMGLDFVKHYPESACEIMQDVAMKQASLLAARVQQ